MQNGDFGLTEDISITFSKAMQTGTFDINLESLEYGNVEFEIEWSNNITLTISPYVVLQANSSYTLSLSGISQDNNNYSETLNFGVATLEAVYSLREREYRQTRKAVVQVLRVQPIRCEWG